ncbi:MAG: helix-hairpin-helix domain-containing protein [Segetibacter sp.]
MILLLAFFSTYVYSQEDSVVQPGSVPEQQLENLTEQQEGETEDDSYLQSLVQLRKNPINLNTAQENELHELRMLSDLQIQSLLSYRRLLGNLISIYELQAVPLWDVETIQQVLPYVRVGNAVPFSADIKQRLTGGQHSILMRSQQVLEKSNGFMRPDSIENRYPGSSQRLFFRYKYIYRNLLQFGMTGDKDAGEQFFKGNQKSGFDFYSFHFFARKLGAVKLLALGDFTVNLGQGLIHWQSLAFKKVQTSLPSKGRQIF